MNEHDLSAALEEINFSVNAFDEARRNVNDLSINSRIGNFIDAARGVLDWHQTELRNSIADDVASLLDGLKSLHIPTHSDDLGRTAGLAQLRGAQGQLVMAILGALETASMHGYRAREVTVPIRNQLPAGVIGVDFLLALSERISDLERSMDELDAVRDDHEQFVQQADLIEFLSGSLRSEARLAKMLLRVSASDVPFGALMRVLEAMTEKINNFWATISAWRHRLSNAVVRSSERVRTSMRRVLRGARTTIKWINRAQIRKAETSLARQEPPNIPSNKSVSRSQLVAEHLPTLRRYARAVSGSQATGDAYVGAALEALLQQPDLLRDSAPRIDLFKLLHQTINNVDIPAEDPAIGRSELQDLPLGKLQGFPLRMREAFLLNGLEDFSEEETAEVLSVDVQIVRRELDGLAREIAAQLATRVMIIEPDMVVFSRISSAVTALGHQVLPPVFSQAEALTLADKESPGIIISEVQLEGGESGLNAVNAILERHAIPAIFITAYPERFLTEVRPEPAFLLSKPFENSKLLAIISYALFFERKSRPPSKFRAL